MLDAENEKRMNELEEEIKELRKRLKARDVRINYLVQENETAREKLYKYSLGSRYLFCLLEMRLDTLKIKTRCFRMRINVSSQKSKY